MRFLGTDGPWVALSPGGRRSLDELVNIATKLSRRGYRVLLHDRRNCGLSEVEISGADAEYEIWADDLHVLLTELGASSAWVGGSSSGGRVAIVLALRHPDMVSGLLLWRVTGGGAFSEWLAKQYYTQYIPVAEAGGMQAICETDEFAALIKARPANRQKLMAMSGAQFIAVMSNWASYFLKSVDLPVVGATVQDLAGIRKPALVVPGNDNSHPRVAGEKLSTLLPQATLRHLNIQDRDVALQPQIRLGRMRRRIAGLHHCAAGRRTRQGRHRQLRRPPRPGGCPGHP